MNLRRFWIATSALATFVVGVSLIAYATGKFTSEAAVPIDESFSTDTGSAVDAAASSNDLSGGTDFPIDNSIPNFNIDSSGNIISGDPNLDPNADGTPFPIQVDQLPNYYIDADGNIALDETSIGNIVAPECADGQVYTGSLCVPINDYVIGSGDQLSDFAAQAVTDYEAARATADRTGSTADIARADALGTQATTALAKANTRDTGTRGRALNAITPPPPVKLKSFLQRNFASLDSILRIGVPRLLISFAGLITLVVFLINAVKFLFGAGNEQVVTEARQGMLFAGIGFTIVIAAYLVVTLAANIFK